MRRKEKEITDTTVLQKILCEEQVIRLGILSDNLPYIVPMNFVYHDNSLYIHSALEGRKIDAIKQNPRICFEVETESRTVPADSLCGYGTGYKSIIGYGDAKIIESDDEKESALNLIVKKYAPHETKSFSKEVFGLTCFIRIDIESMTGKQSG